MKPVRQLRRHKSTFPSEGKLWWPQHRGPSPAFPLFTGTTKLQPVLVHVGRILSTNSSSWTTWGEQLQWDQWEDVGFGQNLWYSWRSRLSTSDLDTLHPHWTSGPAAFLRTIRTLRLLALWWWNRMEGAVGTAHCGENRPSFKTFDPTK